MRHQDQNGFETPGLTGGEGFGRWQSARRDGGVRSSAWATAFGPGTVSGANDDAGGPIRGVNFGAQDYLSLSSHPAIVETAAEAARRFGADAPVPTGDANLSVALERTVAGFLAMEEAILYPTAWGAGYGAIRGLVRSADHVVLDALSHGCLREGANAATRNVAPFRHLDLEHCRAKLRAIRARDARNGILVVTESLFSMDSDTPDLAGLQALCHEYGATLLVDVAHDLGCLGEDGRGHVGLQDMLGRVDLVTGSFSRTFASNGGFVATNRRSLRDHLRAYSPPATFSNALSPVQAAVILKAFAIVDGAEGRERRARLMRNVVNLRTALRAQDLEVCGEPSAIVSVKIGSESVARLVGRRLPELGLLAHLVESPAADKAAARFRFQVMANHRDEDVARAVACIVEGLDLAGHDLAALMRRTSLRAAA